MSLMNLFSIILLMPTIAVAQTRVSKITTPAVYLKPAAIPGTCTVGEIRFDTGSSLLKVCIASNTWASSASSAPLAVGTFDSQTPNSNGLTIAASTLYGQSASATNPGMVNTTTQTFAGAKTFSGGITATLTGNASTATALAANGANCSAGQFPLGVDASGAVESCTALPTTIAGTANQITASAATGAITLSIPTNPTLPGTTTGTFSGTLSGNASTASALAANPADCGSGQLATTIAANGDLTCTATPTLGVAGATLGTLALAGNTSGTITIKPQAAAGTYNFNLPTTAGNSGDVLTSGGGGSTAMTWSTPLANPMDGQGQLIYGGVAGAVTKLAAGSSGQYLASAGAAAPVWTSIPRSRVRVEVGNGFGSTNTRIRRFTTSVVSTGSDITYADSATNGATFTLGSAGIYSATVCDYKAAGFCNSGISINSAQLTTNIESITNTTRLALQSQSGEISCATATFIGAASDVIRAHGDNRCDGTDVYVNFDIIKISN